MNFHETHTGRRFFDVYVPKLVKAMERIAEELEKINQRAEREESEQDAQRVRDVYK